MSKFKTANQLHIELQQRLDESCVDNPSLPPITTKKAYAERIAIEYADLNSELERRGHDCVATQGRYARAVRRGLGQTALDDYEVNIDGRPIYIEFLFSERCNPTDRDNISIRIQHGLADEFTSIDEQVFRHEEAEQIKKDIIDKGIADLKCQSVGTELAKSAIDTDTMNDGLTVFELIHLLQQLDEDATVHWVKESKYGVPTSTETVRHVEQVTEDNNTFVTLN